MKWYKDGIKNTKNIEQLRVRIKRLAMTNKSKLYRKDGRRRRKEKKKIRQNRQLLRYDLVLCSLASMINTPLSHSGNSLIGHIARAGTRHETLLGSCFFVALAQPPDKDYCKVRGRGIPQHKLNPDKLLQSTRLQRETTEKNIDCIT